MRLHLLIPLALSLVLSACGTSYGGLTPNSSAVRVQAQLPPPDQVALAAADAADVQPALLGPFDTVTVRVFGADTLQTRGTIDNAGMFSMPLAGQIRAGGLTTAQFEQAVAAKLRGRYVKDPQVTVEINELRSQTITVDGAVTQPGIYPVTGRMSLIRAIATARGATDLAALNKVAVFRTIDGKPNAALFSLKDIREGVYADPQIYPNDVIVVGENGTRRFLRDLSQSLPALGIFAPLVRGVP